MKNDDEITKSGLAFGWLEEPKRRAPRPYLALIGIVLIACSLTLAALAVLR